jgi:DNA-binding CsgD family transcriptional regulator
MAQPARLSYDSQSSQPAASSPDPGQGAHWRLVSAEPGGWRPRSAIPHDTDDDGFDGRPLRVRLLYGPGGAPAHLATGWPAGALVEARYLPIRLPAMAIYPGAAACTPRTGTKVTPTTGAEVTRAQVVREPAALAALANIFDAVWESLAPPEDTTPQPARSQPSPTERDVLRLLAAGLDHDAIAHTLHISVRTVRRRISSIHIRLGATSPFQAGLEAARRGWF